MSAPAFALYPPAHPVTCPWCSVFYEVRPGPRCSNCGGPLPAVSAGSRGEAPPEVPRVLPAIFRRQVMFTKNVGAIVGLVFMVVGAPFIVFFGFGLLFLGIGYFVWRGARKQARARIAVLEHGRAVPGTLTEIRRDTSEAINGQNPWRLDYTFDLDGRSHPGFVRSWCPSSGSRQPGEPVWVVVDPARPDEVSSLWPPLV